MLRRLATLYGARPGTLSLLKLARMVVTHTVLTGGVPLGDDMIQQVIEQAGQACAWAKGCQRGAHRADRNRRDRRMPAASYLESQRPRFREMVAEVAHMRFHVRRFADELAAVDLGRALQHAVPEADRHRDPAPRRRGRPRSRGSPSLVARPLSTAASPTTCMRSSSPARTTSCGGSSQNSKW